MSFPAVTAKAPGGFLNVPNGTSRIFQNFSSGFEPEFANVLNFARTIPGCVLPSAKFQIKGNELVRRWKINGIYQSLDIFFNFYHDGNSIFSLIDWKRLFVTTATDHSYAPFSGWTTLAGSGNLNLVYSAYSYFTQSDASIFIHSSLPPTIGNCDIIGNFSAAPRDLISTFGTSYVSLHDNPETGNIANLNTWLKADTINHLTRRSDGIKRYYSNGRFISQSVTTTPGTIPTQDFRIGVSLGQGRPTGTTYRCVAIGASMAGLEQEMSLAWQNYIS